MTVKELKQVLEQYPDDMKVCEGPNVQGAADCYIKEVHDGEETFLLVIGFI